MPSMNHHILAKATTDAVLFKFKHEEWRCINGIGRNFYRVTTDASFPSPDAAFYDDPNHFLVSFEFKPPTETKRGILTGVGQSIAYLQNSNVSFLVAPRRLEDYDLGSYLTDLYAQQIFGKIPSGLILYDNETPGNVELVSCISDNCVTHRDINIIEQGVTTSRFWAKHQDLPIALFHLLLHCYFLKKSHIIDGDAFKYCWTHYLISPTVLNDFQPKVALDINNQPIKTPAGTKDFKILEKILANPKHLDEAHLRELVRHEIDTEFVGDNKYQAYRKNFTSFLKHIHVIDSSGDLTDRGFVLYHLGLKNGPTSQVFIDYFTKEVLTTGHHLELLLDLDKVIRDNPLKSFAECLSEMETTYMNNGQIKRNPGRIAGATNSVGFLKYECILWRSLGLLIKRDNSHSFVNWESVTAICSLPDLL